MNKAPDLLDEVLSDKKEEKRVWYFFKLLPFILILTIIFVIAIYLYDVYKKKHQDTIINTGNALTQAIVYNNTNIDDVLDNIIFNIREHVVDIAMLKKIALSNQRKDLSQSKLLLQQLILDNNYQQITRDYAKIIWMAILLNEDQISEEDNDKFHTYMSHFNNINQIFFDIAQINYALLYIKEGKYSNARDVLERLAALQNISPNIYEVSQMLLSNLN
ncbi:MAG: hypothetical protein AB8B67_03845 [Rickettsiaceae bacterium]